MSARPGQIVGIAGVQGSGHGQLLRAVAGVDHAGAGAIFVDEIPLPLGSVGRAVKAGILLVPADRLGASIVPSMSIRANLTISGRIRRSARRFGLRWPSVERGMARTYIRQLGIRPNSSETLTAALSGGNQQKVALARGFEAGARILLIEEPTQGVDVGAKAELHSLLRYAAIANGCTIVIASSEFEELIGLADEIHVMREGRVVASVAGADATYAKILEHALS
jgi:ABC-type sugar transport system ATPase subunit